ncbi:hypothetical protein QQ045_001168 [Rhodiola kirilowii]
MMNFVPVSHKATNNLETTSIDDVSYTFVYVSGKKSWIPKCPVELKLVVGMLFPDLDQAILFYKEYARIAGFVVRMATSNMSDKIVTRKALSLVDKQLIMECGKVCISASKAYHIRKKLCGGFMNVGATATDYENYKRDLKSYIGLNDAQMVVDHLSDKKKTCQGYSFEYFSDGEGTLSRLFWSDGISKRDIIIFGDVVSFDATYRMNKYNLVFVPFTGIDNQLRSVALAAGLISMEDVDSYTWLLTCFKTMLEREPSVIVTDQDASMKTAIATIFPLSRHRYVNMGALLRTTSRSGSDNSFFGRYIGRFMILVEFFMGFNSAMDLQRQNRVHLDRESRCFVPTLNSTLNLEKHASETFSFPVFKKF